MHTKGSKKSSRKHKTNESGFNERKKSRIKEAYIGNNVIENHLRHFKSNDVNSIINNQIMKQKKTRPSRNLKSKSIYTVDPITSLYNLKTLKSGRSSITKNNREKSIN